MSSQNYQNGLYARHISTDLANYEAARSAFFTLTVDGGTADTSDFKAWDNLVLATVDPTSGEITAEDRLRKDAAYNLSLNVLSTSVPHFSLETLEYKRGNEKVKFAGTPTFDSGEVVIDDVVGIRTKDILMAWQAAAYNVHTGKGGRMKDYKMNCTLTEYTQDYVAIRKWKLVGCWISKISEDSFDKESDGKRKMTATVEYDRAIPEVIQVA